jgi:MFS family permease
MSSAPSNPLAANQPPAAPGQRWFRELTNYHWLVLVVCTLAWFFDCFNQQIFNLSRKPAMADLLSARPDDARVVFYGGWSTAALLIGWATGGIIFGMLGDRIGRVKTLVIMILCYSLSTGLCGLSRTQWDYIFFCFVTGVGAGGIFPVGCTLVAESLPDRARPHALGMLQAFSGLGNVVAGFIYLAVIQLWSHGVIASQWRWLFAVGILPSLLSIIVFRKLREPEAWKKAVALKDISQRVGSLVDLFGDRRWRPRAIVGMLLAASGVIGLWGIGVFSNDLTQTFVGKKYDADQRTLGQADLDRQFVAQVFAAPAQIGAIQGKVQAKDLLGTGAGDADSSTLYAAALNLYELFITGGSPQASWAAWADAHGDNPEGFWKMLSSDLPTYGRRLTAEELSKALGQCKTIGENAPRLIAAERAAPSASSVPEHVDRILRRQKTRGITSAQWAAITLIMFNLGGFVGMYSFAHVTTRIGRRPTFAIFFMAAGIITVLVFLFMAQRSDVFWMAPLMGAAQLSVFGGYAIYFPELFPTRLRSTGSSFCYNVARYVAASGPSGTALLTRYAFAGTSEPFRYAGVAMCTCYLVGLVALLFAPETRGQPLPE